MNKNKYVSHPEVRVFEDTSPIFMEGRVINDNTEKHRREVEAAHLDLTPSPTQLSTAREFEDSSQIFHTLSPTEQEFWGEEKEPHRMVKIARGVGYAATRLTDAVYGSLHIASAGIYGLSEMGAKASANIWNGIDDAYETAGISPEGPLRQHASKNIERGNFVPQSTTAISRGSDLIMGREQNKPWDNRFATLAEKDRLAAKKAYDSGDTAKFKMFLDKAKENKRIHENHR